MYPMSVLAKIATPPKVGVGCSCELLLIGSTIKPLILQILIMTGIDLQVIRKETSIDKTNWMLFSEMMFSKIRFIL
jgi:hypothetical protein